jgi:cis-3-alkyl-4-acyloxetan-2-one decarboxylase
MVRAMSPKRPIASRALDEFLSRHPGKDFDRGGLRLHYLDEGQGLPVVMIHGNPTWSFYYRRLAEALSPSYRVIVPDHIGCGFSDKPDDSRYTYTLASRVDDLVALLDHLGIECDVTLIVHDWGGMIGMAYATRYPERITKLVILNTAAFHMPAGKRLPAALWLVRNTPLGAWLVRGFNAFARGTAWIGCARRRMPRELRNAYAAPYDTWANRIATLRFVQDIPRRPRDRCHDLVSTVEQNLDRLASIPMLIAWGMKDFVFDHHFLEEWNRRFPQAEYHRFPRGGHYVLEDEAETLVPLIQRFLGTPRASLVGWAPPSAPPMDT